MGPNWLNNLLANGGNTQLAKFEPKKTKLTCVLEIFILEDNNVTYLQLHYFTNSGPIFHWFVSPNRWNIVLYFIDLVNQGNIGLYFIDLNFGISEI